MNLFLQMSLNDLDFHNRFFSTSEPPSKLAFSLKQGTAAFKALFTSFARWVIKGPTHKEWNLSYHLTNSMLRAIISASRGDSKSIELPDFNHIQKRAIETKPYEDKEIMIEQESFTPAGTVIAFLKKKMCAEAEWPLGKADDLDVMIHGDWISTNDAETDKIVLHFHGGGYVQLSNKTHRPMTARIAKIAKVRVYSVNYRLAPQCPYPCALIDAVSAYLHLLKSYKPQNICLMGDSAGGGLSLACMMLIRDMGITLPSGAYLQSPWVDLSHTISKKALEGNAIYDYVIGPPPDHRKGPNREHYYAPNALLKEPYVSPYWGSFQQLPPLLVQGGTAERLYDEIEAVCGKAILDGEAPITFHRYLHHVHVFPFFFSLNRACDDALNKGGQWIKETLCCRDGAHSQSKAITFDFKGRALSEQIYFDGKAEYVRILH